MPWCPKCKNEYRAGFRVCTECGCELVEELTEQETVQPCTEETQNEENGFVLPDEPENVSDTPDREEETEKPEPAGIYEDSAKKAEDNRSSGLMLLSVGLIGMGIMVLGMTGVLPIRLSAFGSYMVYGVMSALFILFIVMGVVSMRSSKIFAKKAESENSLRSTIEKWCLDTLKAEELDRELFGENGGELAEEMKYFRRTELIKKKIQNQFLNLDVRFLEHFTDEIYGDIFEEKE